MNKRSVQTAAKLAFAFVAIIAAGAQAAEAPRPAVAPQAHSFKADYGTVLDTLESALGQNGNTRSLKLLQQSRMRLNTVSDANLARVFGDAGVPDLSSSVAEIRRYQRGWVQKSAGLPGAGSIHSACDSNPYDADSVYGALIAAQVTSSILAAATFVCTQDILGENGSAVCIPFAIADDIAQGIFAVRSWCSGEAGGSKSDASYERLGHVHDDLADARATLLSNASTNLTSILNNSNTNTTTITGAVTTATTTLNGAITNSTNSIVTNNNVNTASIIANSNANTTTTNNNINANTTTIVNTSNSNTASIITNANANRDALVGEIRAVACEIVRLLNTPDGQRSSAIQACMGQPGFPYSWNKR